MSDFEVGDYVVPTGCYINSSRIPKTHCWKVECFGLMEGKDVMCLKSCYGVIEIYDVDDFKLAPKYLVK